MLTGTRDINDLKIDGRARLQSEVDIAMIATFSPGPIPN